MPLRRPRARRPWRALSLAVAALALAGGAQADPKKQQELRVRSLAATCAQCHGTEGRAIEGEAMIRLAGLQREYILTQLMAFRTGDRKATIMHQITRGYSEEQLETLATYFAARK